MVVPHSSKMPTNGAYGDGLGAELFSLLSGVDGATPWQSLENRDHQEEIEDIIVAMEKANNLMMPRNSCLSWACHGFVCVPSRDNLAWLVPISRMSLTTNKIRHLHHPGWSFCESITFAFRVKRWVEWINQSLSTVLYQVYVLVRTHSTLLSLCFHVDLSHEYFPEDFWCAHFSCWWWFIDFSQQYQLSCKNSKAIR